MTASINLSDYLYLDDDIWEPSYHSYKPNVSIFKTYSPLSSATHDSSVDLHMVSSILSSCYVSMNTDSESSEPLPATINPALLQTSIPCTETRDLRTTPSIPLKRRSPSPLSFVSHSSTRQDVATTPSSPPKARSPSPVFSFGSHGFDSPPQFRLSFDPDSDSSSHSDCGSDTSTLVSLSGQCTEKQMFDGHDSEGESVPASPSSYSSDSLDSEDEYDGGAHTADRRSCSPRLTRSRASQSRSSSERLQGDDSDYVDPRPTKKSRQGSSSPPRVRLPLHACTFCSKAFTRAADVIRHQDYSCRGNPDHKEPVITKCKRCKKSFSRPDATVRHELDCRGRRF